MKRFCTWLRERWAEPANNPFSRELVSPPLIRVITIPCLDNDNTPTSAISEALVALSQAMKELNSSSTQNNVDSLATDMAAIITNVVNIMSTVPNKDRPKRTSAYHVFATMTAIASFLNAKATLITRHPNPGSEAAQRITNNVFRAYIYFGMAVLATPTPYTFNLAAAIAMAVTDATRYRCDLSPVQAYTIAEEITNAHSPRLAGIGGLVQPEITNPPPYISPLVSVFTKDQLAGFARAIASIRQVTDSHSNTSQAIETASYIFDNYLSGYNCPKGDYCRSKGLPVCFCVIQPYPEESYRGPKLLSGI